MFGSMATIAMYLLIVLGPVLIPAMIHAVHAVRDRRQTHQPGLAARDPRPAVYRRRAVPAAA
jgi:hypothetical protein